MEFGRMLSTMEIRKIPPALALTLMILSPCNVNWASIIPPQYSDSAVRVRVRLAEALPVVALRGYDLRFYELGERADQGRVPDRRLALAPDMSSRWEIRCEGATIHAYSGTDRKVLQMRSPVAVSTPAGLLTFANRPYRDEIRIYSTGAACEVVNELDIEKYLDGLINAEFNSQWSEAATEAQIVAARTYALYQIRATRALHPRRNYDLDATIRDQVYDGYFSEDFRGSRAVERTRGLILTASQDSDKPIKAFYSSTCAGKTELPERVWGKPLPGFRHEVVCPYCAHSPRMNWELDLSPRRVLDSLFQGAEANGAPSSWPPEWRTALRSGRLLDLRGGPTDDSGRLIEVIARVGTGRRTLELSVPANRFRSWLRPARIRSTLFDIIPKLTETGLVWHLQGRGNGHGVGLCQYGAKTMGERGYSMASILKFYYPDTFIHKVW